MQVKLCDPCGSTLKWFVYHALYECSACIVNEIVAYLVLENWYRVPETCISFLAAKLPLPEINMASENRPKQTRSLLLFLFLQRQLTYGSCLVAGKTIGTFVEQVSYLQKTLQNSEASVLYWYGICTRYRASNIKVSGKFLPYSLPSVGPGADPGVQAVSPQVTISHPFRR